MRSGMMALIRSSRFNARRFRLSALEFRQSRVAARAAKDRCLVEQTHVAKGWAELVDHALDLATPCLGPLR